MNVSVTAVLLCSRLVALFHCLAVFVEGLSAQCLRGSSRLVVVRRSHLKHKCQCTTLLLPKREIHSTTGEL